MQLRRPPPRFLHGRRFNVDVLSVPDEDMVAFTAQVDQLNAEVENEVKKLAPLNSPANTESQNSFILWSMTSWLTWYMNWLVWRGLHEDGLSRLPSSAGIEFGKWRSEFNVLLQEYIAFGGQTVLDPSDPSQPVDPPPVGDDDPWYVEVADVVSKNIIVTGLVGIAALLAYLKITSPGR